MIGVIATIELVEGGRDEFLKIFHALRPTVLAERGCLQYVPMVDLPAKLPVQTPIRSDVVTIVEQWESLESLEAHLAAAHMHEYRRAVKSLVVNVRLQVLQPA